MDGINPVHACSQRMSRIAVGSILYQCRIGRVQKPALELLGHLLCHIIESLFRHGASFSAGTPSVIQYEGFEDDKHASLRRNPDFSHEASTIMDIAMTCLAVNPSSFLFLTGLGGGSWNPDYALTELVEYCRIQCRFGEGQGETLRRMLEGTDSEVVARWNRSTDRLPRSIFENNGFINTAFSVIPRPTSYIEEIPATLSSQQNSAGSVREPRPLEPIQEEM